MDQTNYSFSARQLKELLLATVFTTIMAMIVVPLLAPPLIRLFARGTFTMELLLASAVAGIFTGAGIYMGLQVKRLVSDVRHTGAEHG